VGDDGGQPVDGIISVDGVAPVGPGATGWSCLRQIQYATIHEFNQHGF
jgi:hypothetical protein